jgi:hypothetical protein
VVRRIEELAELGVQRHANFAVDSRASTHLQVSEFGSMFLFTCDISSQNAIDQC